MANVIESTFRLIRATKRRPHRGEHELPPTVGHLLRILTDNDGASSGELCEILDVRPSSMSELLTRMEEHGLIERKVSEADRRITRAFLTAKGNEIAGQMAERRAQAEAEFSACFTEEEKVQFCVLADKLARHLEESAPKPGCCRPRHGHGPGPDRPHGCGPDHPHGHGCDPDRPHGHGCGPDRPHGCGPDHPHGCGPDHPHGHGCGPDRPHGHGCGPDHPHGHGPARGQFGPFGPNAQHRYR